MDKLLNIVLHREWAAFSPVYYRFHRQRLKNSLGGQSIFLLLTLAFAILGCYIFIFENGPTSLASLSVAIFLFVGFCDVVGTRDFFTARLLPFFGSHIGGTDTWLSGEALLWHSRALDNIAEASGVPPLSSFASGDPLIQGELHQQFEASDALPTIETLLQAEATTLLGEAVLSDLHKLRDALQLAANRQISFSLHLREGNTASGYEMELRQGSYF